MLCSFQCSKLLADTKVIQFYPSKFVLITDILDNFGETLSLDVLSIFMNCVSLGLAPVAN